jgi:hypothetical protein
MACMTQIRLRIKVMIEGKGYGPMFLVTLDFRIFQLATNQTLSVKDSVFRVGVEGVLGGIADTTRTSERVRKATQRTKPAVRLTVVLRRRKRPMKG